jgi:hypothetical protein
MNVKELLVLFLIDKHPSLNSIYSLTQIYDRADFPANIAQVLKNLKESELIELAEVRPLNKMPIYKSSSKGKKELELNFKKTEIFKYIKGLENPDFLYEITQKLIIKN